VLASPDNLSADAFGSIYVVEDGEPNGGDIWKAIDSDKDGVAEAMGVFVSLGISGSEPTGMLWDPNDPYRFVCNVQHPASGNDALWSFRTRPYPGSDQDLVVSSGIGAVPTTGPGEFVRDAHGLDTIVIGWDSPNGSLYGAAFAVFLQPFVTSVGQPAFLPPLWLNPFQGFFVVAGGFAGQFPFVLPYGGGATGLLVPPGLGGISAMIQAAAVRADNVLVVSDGIEIVLK
jgi:hypothetical protein